MSKSLKAEAAQVWTFRERVEHEAADQFQRLAAGLAELGAEKAIVQLAERAAQDEIRHAELCRRVIAYTGEGGVLETPTFGAVLGPFEGDLSKSVLFGCVALSCVTESLSTALLIEMQKRADSGVVATTVHSILQDEIAHSRIGWAYLAQVSARSDVSWLGAYVPGMIREAMQGEAPKKNGEGDSDLSGWGILSSVEAYRIMRQTVSQVILPGLNAFGVGV